MSDEAEDSSRRRVLGLQVRIWGIAGVVLVIGLAVGAMVWAIVAGRDVQTIIGLATLAGILASATGTVVLALKTSDLASATGQMATAALQEAETTARSVELQREELEAVKAQAKLTEDQLQLTRQDFELAGKQFDLARDQAQQQLRQAEASTVMAREMQQERELAARPYISWEIGGGTRVNGVNFGRGPALNTVFCVVDGEQLWRWYPKLLDFSPGQEIKDSDDLVLVPKQGPPPPRPLVGRTVPRKVAICEDLLGNRYRFLPGVVFPDVWRPGEATPDWVTWYEGTAPIAART